MAAEETGIPNSNTAKQDRHSSYPAKLMYEKETSAGFVETIPAETEIPIRRWGFQNYAGDHLISHTLTRAVPSAQRGLTSVFGMGTGVTLAVNSPANCRTRSRDRSQLNRLSRHLPNLRIT